MSQNKRTNQIIEHEPQARQMITTSDANPYLSMAQTLVAKGGDMAQLERLFSLNLEWEKNEARKAFVAAMAAFKTEPMEILKRKTVSFTTRDGDTTSYTHAELADVTDVVVPAMGKHGLSHRWDINQASAQITVTCTITHALGHSESVALSAGGDSSGKKNAIQQVASTVTYLQRYTLLAATGMATKGMGDDDGRSYDASDEPEPIDQKAADWITQCNLVQEPGDLEPLKKKMIADYGGIVSKIPDAVKQAFVDQKAKVMPKDEEE